MKADIHPFDVGFFFGLQGLHQLVHGLPRLLGYILQLFEDLLILRHTAGGTQQPDERFDVADGRAQVVGDDVGKFVELPVLSLQFDGKRLHAFAWSAAIRLRIFSFGDVHRAGIDQLVLHIAGRCPQQPAVGSVFVAVAVFES